MSSTGRVATLILLLASSPASAAEPAASASPDGDWAADLAHWRDAREATLRADDGWLTVAGLFWLKPGSNRVGSAADNDVVLPAPAPAHALRIELAGEGLHYTLAPDARGATSDGAPAAPTGVLHPDSDGTPTLLAFGPVTLHVIRRGERLGVRVRDRDSATRRDFKGRQWYAPDPRWRITARFEPHPRPTRVRVPNVLGQVNEMASPGMAVFTLDGHEVRLTPVLETDDAEELFFIFKDGSSGHGTYPAGRFLYTPLPRDGTLSLDFNRAVNPPCAFTAWATCPLPPEGNRLSQVISAGERFSSPH